MNLSDCTCDASEGRLERVRYFSRQLLNAHDLTDDQTYHRAKQRLHNRLLHGWGIVCGLEVTSKATAQAPLNVTIGPGFALSPQGDEICVPQEIQFDLATFITGPAVGCCSSPCNPILASRVDPAKEFWIATRYVQCPSRPVRVPPIGCGCDDTACEYSRIVDSFEVTCLATLPMTYPSPSQPHPLPLPVPVGVCNILTKTKVIPCPPCPDDPWIVLSTINIKSVGGNQVVEANVEERRLILSAAAIQEHIRQQCF